MTESQPTAAARPLSAAEEHLPSPLAHVGSSDRPTVAGPIRVAVRADAGGSSPRPSARIEQ